MNFPTDRTAHTTIFDGPLIGIENGPNCECTHPAGSIRWSQPLQTCWHHCLCLPTFRYKEVSRRIATRELHWHPWNTGRHKYTIYDRVAQENQSGRFTGTRVFVYRLWCVVYNISSKLLQRDIKSLKLHGPIVTGFIKLTSYSLLSSNN